MVSKVELANMALDALAVDRIASLTEASTPARLVQRRIDGAIEAVLELSDWSFARAIVALAEVTNDDWNQRYERKYDLPSDVLAVIRIVPEIDIPNTPPIDFELANGALYTSFPEVRIQYTRRAMDPAAWPRNFTEAVALKLAMDVAMPLTRKRQNFLDMRGLFEAQLERAIEFDAAQEPRFWSHQSEYLRQRGSTISRTGDGRGTDGSTYWGN
jgi:hypothetical protein